METKARSHVAALAAGPDRSLANMGGWQDRHRAALVDGPDRSMHGNQERAMRLMLQGWALYADAHRRRFDDGIGEDQILGPEWEKIGRALRDLLNGETGRFDCGTLDAFLLDSLKAEGFKEE